MIFSVSAKTKLNEVLVLEEHQISFCFSASTSEKKSYWSITSHRYILKVTSLWMFELAFGPPTKYQNQLTNLKPYLVSLFWKLQSMISCLRGFWTCKVIQYDRRVVWVNSSPCNQAKKVKMNKTLGLTFPQFYALCDVIVSH